MDTPTSESLPSAVPELVNAVRDTADEYQEDSEEPLYPQKSQLSVNSGWTQGGRTFRCSKAYYGEVWQFTGEVWAELYRFNNGLEFDVYSQKPASEVWSRLQLPSTSLRALALLRAAIRLPGALELDATLSGNTPADLFDALIEQAGQVLRAIGGGGASQSEARALLQQRASMLAEEKKEDYEDEDDKSMCSEQLSQPVAGTEAIDLSICPLASFPQNKPPCVALIRLSSPLQLRRGVHSGSTLSFAALILCSSESSDETRFAREFSRALAISYMDEEFAVAARMTPQGSPERVLGSFDSFLSAMTLVPTVYMEPPNPKLSEKALQASRREEEGVPQWESDTNKVRMGYLLSDSVADSIERRICKTKGWPPESRGEVKLHRQRQMREEHPPEHRRRFFVEVHERNGPEQRWTATRRLRQGLQVDITPGEVVPSPPHLPRLSTAALDRMVELLTMTSVGLNAEADTADDAIMVMMEQLAKTGLPADVTEEVLRALMDCATTERDTPSPKAVVGKPAETQFGLAPCPGDESCHLMILASTALPENQDLICAYVRFRYTLDSGFASCDSPVRFIMVLLGPAKARLDLSKLKDALSALLLDEDLMGDLTYAQSPRDFCSMVRRHVNNLVFISHTQLQSTSADHGPEKSMAKHDSEIKSMKKPSLHSSQCSSLTLTTETTNRTSHGHGAKHSPLHRKCLWFIGKLQKYSVPLVSGVIGAMIWENVDSDSYHDFTHTPFWSGAEIFKHELHLHFFVNDIFMCFFFGLAIKEVTEALLPGGSLHPLKRAANPLCATLGGIVGPIAVYLICILIFEKSGIFSDTMCAVEEDEHRRLAAASSTTGTKEELCELSVMLKGWGVPTATDISLAWMFALLVFGAGHPCINFLLLLAIVDDALGMVIIAVFYPNPEKPVEPLWLLLSLVSIALAMCFRHFHVYHWQVYIFIAGPVSWISLLKAHVHPALALCIVVPFMPAQAARIKRKKPGRHNHLPRFLRRFVGQDVTAMAHELVQGIDDVTEDQRARAVERATALLERSAHAPLHAFEHSMKLPVDIGMFFFGLANAGVQVDQIGGVTYSVVIALLVGKTLGIAGFGLLAVCIGFDLPTGISIGDLFAVSALGGIGLTVALFVANQAFTAGNLKAEAKMGAVLSVGCALVAFAIQIACGSREPEEEEDEEEGYSTEPPDSSMDPSGFGSTVDAITDFNAADETDAAWVDDLLVDDILQNLWTQRQYELRGTSMPKMKRRGSISNGRRGSITQVGPNAFAGGRNSIFNGAQKPLDGFARQISAASAASAASANSAESAEFAGMGLRGAGSSDFGARDSADIIGERFLNGDRVKGGGRISTKEVIGERFTGRTGKTPWALRSSAGRSGNHGLISNGDASGTPTSEGRQEDIHLSSPRTLV